MKRFIIAVATGITLTCAGVATVSAQAVIARTPGANGTASVSASPAAQSTTQPILSLDTPEDLKRATALPGLVWTRGSATPAFRDPGLAARRDIVTADRDPAPERPLRRTGSVAA